MPAYLLMIPKAAWSAYDGLPPSPFGLLPGLAAEAASEQGAARSPAATIADVTSETWTYRPELSLLPTSPLR